MKTLLPLSIAAVMLAISAQLPLAAQTASPALSATLAPTATVSASPSGDLADRIHQRFEKKFGRHHGIVIDGGDGDEGHSSDIPPEVFPIVGITMLAVFGAPVLIVALAGMFIFSASRQRHPKRRQCCAGFPPVQSRWRSRSRSCARSSIPARKRRCPSDRRDGRSSNGERFQPRPRTTHRLRSRIIEQ